MSFTFDEINISSDSVCVTPTLFIYVDIPTSVVIFLKEICKLELKMQHVCLKAHMHNVAECSLIYKFLNKHKWQRNDG